MSELFVNGPPIASYLVTNMRLLGLLLTLPGYGERLLGVRLRASLALIMTPLLTIVPEAPVQSIYLAAGTSLLIGLMLGMSVRLIFIALDIATAAIAATASLSQILGAVNEAAPHPIGNYMHLAGLAVLMALGFPIYAAEIAATSLRAWPVGGLPSTASITPIIVDLVRQSFNLGMILAAPFILGGFLYQCLAGMISKAMPQLPIMLIGAPLTILVALAGLAILAPSSIRVWADFVFSAGGL